MKESQFPKTVIELEQWMKDRCYRFNTYGINNTDDLYEGNALEIEEGIWQWYYTERNHKMVLKRFKNEEQAVLYAFEKITSDWHANRNLVGIFKAKKIDRIIAVLKERQMKYWIDQIPYAKDDWRTRVFVVGCDIKKVTDLVQNKYQ